MRKVILIGTLLAFLAGASAEAKWMSNQDSSTNGDGKRLESVTKGKSIIANIDLSKGYLYNPQDYRKIRIDNTTLKGTPGVNPVADIYNIGVLNRIGKKGIWKAFRGGFNMMLLKHYGIDADSHNYTQTIPGYAMAFGPSASFNLRPLPYLELSALASGMVGNPFTPYDTGKNPDISLFYKAGARITIGTKGSIGFFADAGILGETQLRNAIEDIKKSVNKSYLGLGVTWLF